MSRTEEAGRLEPVWIEFGIDDAHGSTAPIGCGSELRARAPAVANGGDDAQDRVLDRFALFRGLPASLHAYVVGHASEHALAEGDALFFKNDASDFLTLVLEGQIHEILYGPGGQELIVAAPRAGETIDEAVLLDTRSRSFTAIACARTRVLKLPRRHFAALTSVPDVLERANDLLCLRLRQTMDSLENICLHRLESRLARYLLLRIGAQGRMQDAVVEVALPATQSVLAAMLNVSRSKLNAQLKTWQRSGFAVRKGHSLQIRDLDQLRRKAYLSSVRALPVARKAPESPDIGDRARSRSALPPGARHSVL